MPNIFPLTADEVRYLQGQASGGVYGNVTEEQVESLIRSYRASRRTPSPAATPPAGLFPLTPADIRYLGTQSRYVSGSVTEQQVLDVLVAAGLRSRGGSQPTRQAAAPRQPEAPVEQSITYSTRLSTRQIQQAVAFLAGIAARGGTVTVGEVVTEIG